MYRPTQDPAHQPLYPRASSGQWRSHHLLGVRSNESEVRRRRIDSYQNYADSNLSPHNSLVGAYIYRPIVELTTDEVWELLSSFAPAWGGDNSRLVKLYRDAAGGECPIVLSQEDAPGCWAPTQPLGCWTCTVKKTEACKALWTAATCNTPP